MNAKRRGWARRRDVGRRVLLGSLDPDEKRFAAVADANWSAVPWNWVIGRARTHKLHPLFLARMERHGFSKHIPDRVREQIDEIREEVQRKTHRAAVTLRQISVVCDEQEIPFAVLKGSHLAEHVYGDAALRVFSDVDILVPLERIHDTERALSKLGYFLRAPYEIDQAVRENGGRGGTPDLDEIRSVLLEQYHHFPLALQPDDPRLPIDVHWTLAKPHRLRLDPASLWQRVAPATICGVETQVLDPAATLVHLALHAVEQSPLDFKLLHLCDVAWYLDRFGEQLDVEAVEETARSWGVRRQLHCALQAVLRVFPFRPAEFHTRFRRRQRRAGAYCALAGIDPLLVDHEVPRHRPVKLARRVFRELVWELALGRPPRRAQDTLHASIGRLLGSLQGDAKENRG